MQDRLEQNGSTKKKQHSLEMCKAIETAPKARGTCALFHIANPPESPIKCGNPADQPVRKQMAFHYV